MPDDITLHTSCQKQVTCISNSFIDHFMPEANGEYVKIYLYLLRFLHQEGKDFSISAMSDALEHTQRDIKRALKYWEKCHLLRLEYDANHNMVGICLLDPDKAVVEKAAAASEEAPVITGRFLLHTDEMRLEEQPIQQTGAVLTQQPMQQTGAVLTQQPMQQSAQFLIQQPAREAVAAENRMPSYSPERIAVLNENEEVKEIFFLAERYIGHTLSATEINSILSWYDGLNMSAELVEYLIEYCVEAGHTSVRYMNKVALNWTEEGITTVEQAKETSSIHSKTYFSVMKAMGISGRQLIKSEQNLVKKWTEQYAFSMEIISEACRRAVTNTGKASFEYADSILTNWYDAGVHYLDDVAVLDQSHSKKRTGKKPSSQNNSFQRFEQREYDYDDIEAKLLQQ